MNSASPALIAAAAGVGLGHAVLPDHWVPLAVLGRTRSYPPRRVLRLSSLAGVAHVLVSILLGAIVIAVGLQLRSAVQHWQDRIVGGLLIATGAGFLVLELTGRGHGHEHRHGHDGHDHEGERGQRHDHAHVRAPAAEGAGRGGRLRGLAAVIVPFGAAASPDLTILPVFLAATTAGAATAVGSLVVFSAVTVATIVGLTLGACFGGYRLRTRWLERWGNTFSAIVLIAIGGLVLAGVI